MRVLVIGGTGFSGPHVVRRLYELGCEILLFHPNPHHPPQHYEKILAERLYLSEPRLPGTILRLPRSTAPEIANIGCSST